MILFVLFLKKIGKIIKNPDFAASKLTPKPSKAMNNPETYLNQQKRDFTCFLKKNGTKKYLFFARFLVYTEYGLYKNGLMIYIEHGSLLRLNVAISGFLRYLWLTAKYGLRQTSESRFLTLL